MTRHTDTHRATTVRLTIEVDGVRDESDTSRHKWRTRARFGLIEVSGANAKDAGQRLLEELTALASSEAATTALAAERSALATPILQPAPPVPLYASDHPIEVLRGDDWTPGFYDGLDGARHHVYIPGFGSMSVTAENIRAPQLGGLDGAT